MTDDDKIIWRADLQAMLGKCSDTIRKMIKNQRLPPPDVDLSRKTKGWKRSTLHRAGVKV